MANELVVGVDTSESSRRAVTYACAAASRSGSTLVLVHVIPWSPFSFTTPDENEHRHQRKEAEIEAVNSQIMEPLSALARECGVDAATRVEHGDPPETLIEIAEHEQATLIIVGRTGDSGLRGRLFGTLAGHLVQQSPIPVTVVP